MEKQMKRRFCITTATIMLVAAMVGCGNAKTDSMNETVISSEESMQITVTFMNGEELLGTATAMAGEMLNETEYAAYENIADAEFQGWFETPSFLEASRKNLVETVFYEDTTLYGRFKATEVEADTRAWYLAGTSSQGILQENNWADNSVEESIREKFRLEETGEITNEFEITIDLFAGDQFQIVHDWAWDGQKGFGCFTTVDTAQMESGGGLGASADTANVNVLMDGNYTITLTTNPSNKAQDTLIVTRNGDIVE